MRAKWNLKNLVHVWISKVNRNTDRFNLFGFYSIPAAALGQGPKNGALCARSHRPWRSGYLSTQKQDFLSAVIYSKYNHLSYSPTILAVSFGRYSSSKPRSRALC